MAKYTFPVQFTFTLEMASEGSSAEDAAEYLEHKLESGKHGIRNVEITFSGWRKVEIIKELQYKHVSKSKARKLPEEVVKLPKPVVVKPKEPEIEKIWPDWYYYPVTKLELPALTTRGLKQNWRSKTAIVGDLARCSESDLKLIRYIGVKARKCIMESLEAHGLHLEMTDEEIRNTNVKW